MSATTSVIGSSTSRAPLDQPKPVIRLKPAQALARFNDDAHQFGGIGMIAADQGIYGRIYISGTGYVPVLG